MSGRRGGIPGPESRTGLTRPAMSEAEFERRQAAAEAAAAGRAGEIDSSEPVDDNEPETIALASAPEPESPAGRASNPTSNPGGRARKTKPIARPKRVQRMFAVEEELDKKLWLYAIHVGKDRSDVINDLLRPLVASMVLYDSRDRRSGRAAEAEAS